MNEALVDLSKEVLCITKYRGSVPQSLKLQYFSEEAEMMVPLKGVKSIVLTANSDGGYSVQARVHVEVYNGPKNFKENESGHPKV